MQPDAISTDTRFSQRSNNALRRGKPRCVFAGQITNFFASASGRMSSYSSNGWWIHGLVGSSST